MRYFLAFFLIFAVGVPAASALPTIRPNSVSASKTDLIAPVAKRSRPAAHRHSRAGNGGIHPLVGSGDY